jgi:hypothetical protein
VPSLILSHVANGVVKQKVARSDEGSHQMGRVPNLIVPSVQLVGILG